MVAAAYLLVYAWLLGAARGLPYVLDNNESFSSTLFARNLLTFPIASSAGLADEALGPSPAAHPVVYTHGGNLPRLFTAVLEVVGVHAVEWQIAVTTFTVGALAVLFCYLFFEAVADSLFATIMCLLLLSDYLLFAEWQVNTWRVWQGFFLFSILVCLRRQVHRRSLAVLLGAGLLYLEMVFGAFVVMLTGLYAAWLYRERLSLAVAWVASLAAGAAAALAVLTAQRAAYLGWDGMLADTFLTYSARLGDSSGTDALDSLRAFYNARHVAFWYNLVDPRAFRSVAAFQDSVFHYALQVWTPLLVLVALVLLAGALLGRLSLRHLRGGRPPLPVTRAGLLTAWVLVLVITFSGDLVLGLPPSAPWRFVVWDGSPLGLVLAVGGAALLTVCLTSLAPRRLRTDRVISTLLLLCGTAVLVRFQYRLYDENAQGLWFQALGPGAVWLGRLGVVAATALASFFTLRGTWPSIETSLKGVCAYVVCGFIAYAAVYGLAAGYVMTGYVTRYAPLLVFVVDAVVALAVYLAVRSMCDWWRVFRARAVNTRAGPLVGLALASALSVFLVGYWGRVQLTYASQLPASLFGFLPTLAQPPYAGASFVVNNYAAPASIFTGQWAYHDPLFGSGASAAGYIVSRDASSYLWEADRETNPAYLKPDYFLCEMPDTPVGVARALERPDLPAQRCSALPLVEGALRGGGYPHTLVARDQSGHDAWAIVRLNPAFELAPGERPPPTPQGDVALGDHWYPFEAYLGETFRWASNDAELTVTAPLGPARPLVLEIEPGPGVGLGPVDLQVLDEQGLVATVVPLTPGRQVARVTLPLAPGATATYRLHVDGGGRATPGDPRTLTFRVFHYGWEGQPGT